MEDVRPFVHRPDVNEEPDICPECNGRGVGFQPVGHCVRREVPCPSCKGTGKLSTALAGRLSGEYRPVEPVLDMNAFQKAHS